VRVKAVAKHARPAGMSPGPARPRAGISWAWHDGPPGSAVAPGRVRADPLSDPIAITERPVLGDQIRRPIVWCEIATCLGRYEDPVALGEADIRARAIGAGWRHDAAGRLACPACQQRSPDMWPAYPAVPRARTPAGENRRDDGHARAGGGTGGALVPMASRARNFGTGRRARLWQLLLAMLTTDSSGSDALRRAPASDRTGRGRRAGSAGHRRSRHRALPAAPAHRLPVPVPECAGSLPGPAGPMGR
jgi:hypothetical protein